MKPSPSGARSGARTAAAAALVGVVYYLGAQAGFELRFPASPISMLWPPNSLLLAAFLLASPRRWWAYLLAALPAHVAVELRYGVPLVTMLGLFCTNAGQALLGAAGVRRLVEGPFRLDSLRRVVIFMVCAALLAPFVNAFVATALIVGTGWGADYWLSWRAQFLSNVLTVLTLVPTVLALAADGASRVAAELGATSRRPPWKRWAEGGLLALGLVAASWLLFSGQGASPTSLPALLYVPLPFLLWAALRLGTGGLSLSVLFVAGWAVLYAAAGLGPFSGLTPLENVVSLQLYLIAVTVPLLALAALMRERERTAGLLRASEERYRTVVEAAPIGIAGVDPAGRFLQTNRAFREMLGYGEDELRHLSFDDVSAPEDAAASERLLAELRDGRRDSIQLEKRYRRKDGRLPWGRLTGAAVRDAAGALRYTVAMVEDVTARKRAEEALRRSEATLAAAQRIAHLGSWAHDLRTGELAWSDEKYRILGFAPGAVTPTHEQLMAAVHPDDRACLERAVEEAAAAGTAYDLEHRVVRPDGAVRTVHSRGQIVADDTGRPLRWVGSMLDITERKRAELALARLAAIVESSDDAIISKDLDGVVVSWNPGAERLYGYAAAEVVGRPIALLIPPERPDELPGIMARLGRGERITQFETVRLCKDGRRVEVSVSIAPIRDRAGAVVGASTIARDITAQKRAEEALRESEARFRMMADTAPVLIWMSDEGGGCTFFNRPWLAFTGRALAQELGEGWVAGVHPADRAGCLGGYQAALAARRPFTLEYRLRRADGAYRWLIDNGVPRLAPDGSFLGYIGSALDISERKAAEEALRESEARLRLLLETTNAVPWETCVETGQVTYVGPHARQLLGYPLEQWYEPGFWAAHLHPDDRERALAACHELSARCEDFDLVYRMVSAAGGAVWVHSLTHVACAGGKPEALRGFLIDVTGPREAEEALRQSEAKFRGLFESNIVPMCLYFRDGVLRDANEAFLGLTGYTRAELEADALTLERITPPEYRDLDARAIAESREKGACTPFEKEYVRRDGRRVPVLAGGATLPGFADRGFGFAIDLTERKRAEAALRESERRYQLATAAGRVSAWDRDLETGAFVADGVMYALLGSADQEPCTYDAWLDLIHPEDRARVLTNEAAALDPAAPLDAEGNTPLPEIVYRVFHPDGSIRWFADRGTVLRRGGTIPYRVLGTATDISRRMWAEEALRASERRYRALFEQASDAVLIAAGDGTYLDANEQACALLGYRRKELIGLKIDDVIVAGPGQQAASRAAARAGRTIRFEGQARRKGGGLVPVEAVARTLEDGRIQAMVRDISERKAAEEALHQLSARLLQLQDEERRRIARELHDVTAQNLFALTVNLAQLQQRVPRPGRGVAELLADSRALGEQSLRELRTLSYLLHPPLLDQVGLVSALEWYVEGFRQRSGIAVTLTTSGDLERLPGDVATALFRIVQESLTNIHRHSGSGTAGLTLANEGGAIILRVEDRGRGMTGELAPAARDGVQSLGVGIPGMRERVRQLGGRLEIASGAGGTTVTAVVPLGEETRR